MVGAITITSIIKLARINEYIYELLKIIPNITKIEAKSKFNIFLIILFFLFRRGLFIVSAGANNKMLKIHKADTNKKIFVEIVNFKNIKGNITNQIVERIRH